MNLVISRYVKPSAQPTPTGAMAPTRQQLMRCASAINQGHLGTVCASVDSACDGDGRPMYRLIVYHSGLTDDVAGAVRAILREHGVEPVFRQRCDALLQYASDIGTSRSFTLA